MIEITLLYIDQCPLWLELKRSVETALSEMPSMQVRFQCVPFQEMDSGQQALFLGSPTLLINGRDAAGAQGSPLRSPACRWYPNGLPDLKTIRRWLILADQEVKE